MIKFQVSNHCQGVLLQWVASFSCGIKVSRYVTSPPPSSLTCWWPGLWKIVITSTTTYILLDFTWQETILCRQRSKFGCPGGKWKNLNQILVLILNIFKIFKPVIFIVDGMCPVNEVLWSLKSKNGHILPTGQWYAPSAVINDALIMPEYARACQSMPEYARVCKSMPEYARVYQSMPEYARVCQSIQEFARVCQSLAKFCLYIAS